MQPDQPEPRVLLTADFDPFAEETYTVQISSSALIGLADALTALHSLATGQDVSSYRNYLDDGRVFFDAISAVEQQLDQQARPRRAQFSAWIRAHAAGYENRN